MVKTLINNGIIIVLGGAGFCPSTVVMTMISNILCMIMIDIMICDSNAKLKLMLILFPPFPPSQQKIHTFCFGFRFPLTNSPFHRRFFFSRHFVTLLSRSAVVESQRPGNRQMLRGSWQKVFVPWVKMADRYPGRTVGQRLVSLKLQAGKLQPKA